MPQVDDEDKSRRVAVVPHFVLERVVKHNELALAPRPAKHTHIPVPIKCTSTTAISESRSCANLVSSATRMRGPAGTTRPRCARRRQLVGPQCGHTCTPGCITENLICNAKQRAVIDPKSSGLLHSWFSHLAASTSNCIRNFRHEFTGFWCFETVFRIFST